MPMSETVVADHLVRCPGHAGRDAPATHLSMVLTRPSREEPVWAVGDGRLVDRARTGVDAGLGHVSREGHRLTDDVRLHRMTRADVICQSAWLRCGPAVQTTWSLCGRPGPSGEYGRPDDDGERHHRLHRLHQIIPSDMERGLPADRTVGSRSRDRPSPATCDVLRGPRAAAILAIRRSPQR